MDEKVLFFFSPALPALPLYERLETCIRAELRQVDVRVQTSQISFYNTHLFACVSFAKVRKTKDRPPFYIVVTFGLDHRLDSPRIDQVSQPYPNRFTHHVLISSVDEIDQELMCWLREAAAFSASKSRRKPKE